MKLKYFLYLILILSASSALGAQNKLEPETILPDFSGQYYGDLFHIDYDSCFNERFSYDTLSDDPQKIANKLIETYPRQDCTWDKTATLDDKSYTYIPRDFPGNSDDFKNLGDKGFPVTQIWSKHCRNKAGDLIWSSSAFVLPKYLCPSGSVSYIDYGAYPYDRHCSKNTLCRADIVARTLDVIIFSSKGHAGLISYHGPIHTKASVMEVLNESDVIQNNEMNQFMAKTKFWGARFQHNTMSKDAFLSEYESTKITGHGFMQRDYHPTYTKFPYYIEGKDVVARIFNTKLNQWQLISSITNAVFRCDTFVIFAYKKGAQIDLPFTESHTNPLAFSPRQLFLEDFFQERIPPQEPILSSANNLDELEVSTEFKKLTDPSISRDIKIQRYKNELTAKIAGNVSDKDHDIFASTGIWLQPNELMDELIEAYKKVSNRELKIVLLHIIEKASERIAELALSHPTSDLSRQSISLQKFSKEIALLETDPEILREIFLLLPHALPPEEAATLSDNILIDTARASAISQNERLNQLFLLAIAQAPQEPTRLTTLLFKDKQEQNSNTHNELDNVIVTHLANMSPQQIDLMGMAAKKLLAQYLRSYSIKAHISDDISMVSPSHWLQAFAAVSNSATDHTAFMANYIVSKNDEVEQMALIAGQDIVVIKSLPKELLNNWRNKIIAAAAVRHEAQLNAVPFDTQRLKLEQQTFSSIVAAIGPANRNIY